MGVVVHKGSWTNTKNGKWSYRRIQSLDDLEALCESMAKDGWTYIATYRYPFPPVGQSGLEAEFGKDFRKYKPMTEEAKKLIRRGERDEA